MSEDYFKEICKYKLNELTYNEKENNYNASIVDLDCDPINCTLEEEYVIRLHTNGMEWIELSDNNILEIQDLMESFLEENQKRLKNEKN